MTDVLTIDNLTNRTPKKEPKQEHIDDKYKLISLPEGGVILPEKEVNMSEPKTKRDSISDDILDVMLNDDNLEKMTDLNTKSAMVYARADTMAEIFDSNFLRMFSKKGKQHLVSNKRLGRTEVSEVLNNIGDTVDDSESSLKQKMFGDTF